MVLLFHRDLIIQNSNFIFYNIRIISKSCKDVPIIYVSQQNKLFRFNIICKSDCIHYILKVVQINVEVVIIFYLLHVYNNFMCNLLSLYRKEFCHNRQQLLGNYVVTLRPSPILMQCKKCIPLRFDVMYWNEKDWFLMKTVTCV